MSLELGALITSQLKNWSATRGEQWNKDELIGTRTSLFLRCCAGREVRRSLQLSLLSSDLLTAPNNG